MSFLGPPLIRPFSAVARYDTSCPTRELAWRRVTMRTMRTMRTRDPDNRGYHKSISQSPLLLAAARLYDVRQLTTVSKSKVGKEVKKAPLQPYLHTYQRQPFCKYISGQFRYGDTCH
jgi:hypothetical protein